MRSRVHFTLRVSPADGETVRAAIANDLGQRSIFFRDVDCAVRTMIGPPPFTAVTGQIRFSSPAEADTFWNRVVSRWTSGGIAGRILAGSFLERHDCPHDDAQEQSCIVSQRVVK